jgi:dihydrofolate reductase
MRITIIAAMGRNRVIGTEAGLPWRLPRELRQFRALTIGKPVVMGRTTFQHIGRPLPDRANIVLTRQQQYAPEGVHVAHSVDEALEAARREGRRLKADEVMVIGGEEVYRAFLPLADRMYLTVVDGEFEGTAVFPLEALRGSRWVESARRDFPADERNRYACTVWHLDRVTEGEGGPTNLPELLGVE